MTRKLPEELRVELNSLYPRWPCYVHDSRGTANGGFFRGFKSHAELYGWIEKHGYQWFSGSSMAPLASRHAPAHD